MRRSFLTIAVSQILLAVLCPAVLAADIKPSIDSILLRPEFARGMHGCVVIALDTGKTVYARNPDTLLMSASNMKIYTSVAALEILGADFKYPTRLLADGPIGADGTLEGNIVLRGSGNPLFDTQELEFLVADAVKQGLKRVNGSVVVDTGVFDRTPYGSGWSWDYLSDYYAAPAGAVNYHKNVADVTVDPALTPGLPALVSVGPVEGYLRVRNETTTTGEGGRNSLDRWRDVSTRTMTVSGSVPKNANASRPSFTVAVYDPADYAGEALKQQLAKSRVPVSGSVRAGTSSDGARELAVSTSEPLSSIVKRLNKWSDNLVAECLLRTIGAEKRDQGSIRGGREEAYSLFAKAGLEISGLNIADGSGLSRMNLITAENTAKLLQYMSKSKNYEVFYDSLPIAGQDGTLSNRMKGTPAAGNVRAKTGYIGNVSSLSGYVTTAAGQPLVFSMIFNHQAGSITPCRKAQDDLGALLAGLKDKL